MKCVIVFLLSVLAISCGTKDDQSPTAVQKPRENGKTKAISEKPSYPAVSTLEDEKADCNPSSKNKLGRSAFSPRFTELARNARGDFCSLSRANAAFYCENRGLRLPTVREFALLATILGAKGIREINEYAAESEANKDGYLLLNPENEPPFYFNGNGFEHHRSDLGNGFIWSSSEFSYDHYYGLGFFADYGQVGTKPTYGGGSVICIINEYNSIERQTE